MANLKVLFEIAGNSSGAEAAINRTASALGKINSAIQNTSARAGQLQQKLNGLGSSRVGTQSVDNFNKRIELADRTVVMLQNKLRTVGSQGINVQKVEILEKSLSVAESRAAKLGTALQKATNQSPTSKKTADLSKQYEEATLRVLKLKEALDKAKLPPDNEATILSLEKRLMSAKEKADALRNSMNSTKAPVAATSSSSSSSGSSSGSIFTKITSAFGGGGGSSLTAGVSSATSGLKVLAGWVDTGRKGFMAFTDMVRLTSQSLTNVGRNMLFFLTIPVGGFLLNMTRQAIDFQDALIRVQKVTGMSAQGLSQLSENLRLIARNSPVANTELASVAATIGQMGVTSPAAIASLTNIFQMLSVATGVSADIVTNSLARIANAFGQDLNTQSGVDFVMKLSNVMNLLENATAATTEEILTSVSKWAQAAAQMNISATEAAALAASLVSMGMSENEAGTGLRNLSIYLIRNAAAVAQVMGKYDAYNSQQKVLQAINEDTVQVFIDIADAAQHGDDNAAKFLALMDIGNMRGGRALAALASNVEMVKNNLALANKEWETHNSLLVAYQRAMASTKNQIAMLKNNITDAGVTIGDALLPVINNIVQIAVPAIRMLSDAFKNLPKNTQLMVVGITAIALIAGPILMLFGSMLHSVSLMAMGFGQLLRLVPMFLNGLSALGPALAGIASFLFSWPGLILASIVLILKVLSQMGVNIGDFFANLAQSALTWGENLAKTFASGILAGAVRFVTRAIAWVGNLIASFLKGNSPPEKGPLSTINQWGSKVLQAYLNGFKNADFSVLNDVGKTIEAILTRGVDEKGMPAALKRYAKARVIIAKLIAKYNKTGILDEKLLKEATAGLGHMADDVRELLRLSLEYEKVQARLAALEEARKQVLKGYDAEVAAIALSNKGIVDKVAAIRAAQRARDDELRGMDEEKTLLEEQAAAMKERLDFQKNMIDSMNEQDDILQRIKDAIEALKKAAETGGAGGGGGFEFDPNDSLGDLKKKLDDASTAAFNIVDQFEKGRTKLQGFIDAWKGMPKENVAANFREGEGDVYPQDLVDGYDSMYNLGLQAANVRDRIGEIIAKAVELKDKFLGLFQGGGQQQGDSKGFELPQPIKDALARLQPSIDGLGASFETLSKSATGFFTALGDTLSKPEVQQGVTSIAGGLGELALALANGGLLGLTGIFNGLATVLPVVANAFDRVMIAIQPAINWLSVNVPPVITAIGTVFGVVGKALGAFFTAIKPGLTLLGKGLAQAGATLANMFKQIAPALGPLMNTLGVVFGVIGGVLAGIVNAVLTVLGVLIPAIAGVVSGIVQVLVGMFRLLYNGVMQIIALVTGNWAEFQRIGQESMEVVKGIFSGAWEAIYSFLGGIIALIWGAISSFVEGVVGFFTDLYNRLIGNSIVPDMLNGIWNAFITILANILISVITWMWDVINFLTASVTDMLAAGKALVQNVWDGMVAIWGGLSTWFQGILTGADSILSYLTSGKLLTDLTSGGQKLLQGLWDGMLGKWTEIKKWFGTILTELPDWVKKLLGIKSPSKIFMEIGKNVTAGFGLGLMDGIGDVEAALNASIVGPTLGMSKLGFDVTSGSPMTVNLNDPIVREEQDFQRLVNMVMAAISNKAYQATRYGGAPSF